MKKKIKKKLGLVEKSMFYLNEMITKDFKPTYSICKNIGFKLVKFGRVEESINWFKYVLKTFGYILNPPDLIKFKSICAGQSNEIYNYERMSNIDKITYQ
jgi:hypothetical protein